MTPLDVLRGARELIAKPEAWTKGAWARDEAGECCPSTDTDACTWCVSGAMRKVAYRDENARLGANNALRGIRRDYVSFNDAPSTTHADVLAMLDRAIAGLEP